MALADPLPLTYGAAPLSLARVGSDNDGSKYRFVDASNNVFDLAITHDFNKKNRVVVRLELAGLVSDPRVTDQSIPARSSCTLTCNWDINHSTADAQNLYNCLRTFLDSATFLKVAKGET